MGNGVLSKPSQKSELCCIPSVQLYFLSGSFAYSNVSVEGSIEVRTATDPIVMSINPMLLQNTI